MLILNFKRIPVKLAQGLVLNEIDCSIQKMLWLLVWWFLKMIWNIYVISGYKPNLHKPHNTRKREGSV